MIANAPNIVGFSSNTPVPRDSATSGAMSSLSAWKAFQSGMQILRRYANHSPVDVDAIAKSNLQLLHRSLMQDAQYTNYIEDFKYDSTKSGRPRLRHLYASEGLIADVLALKINTPVNLITLPQRYTMYLLISGSVRLGANKINDYPGQHWWNHIVSRNSDNYLRSGAVIIFPTHETTNKITACGKDCLILRIQIPLLAMPCEIAS